MNRASLGFANEDFLYWLILGSAVVALSLLFVPLDTLVRIGIWFIPFDSLQEKTILLLRVIKIVLPIIGLVGLGWLYAPGQLRQTALNAIHHISVSKWSVLAILLFACLIRFAWVAFFPSGLYADSEWYFEKGSQIANGLGYIYDLTSRKPTAVWPVGYPAFLALLFLVTGPNLFIAKFANVMLSVLAVTLTFKIADTIFGRRVALGSAFFIAILPGYVVYSSLVASDPLFITLALAVLWLILVELAQEKQIPSMQSALFIIVIGLINGFMALTRSIGFVLVPFWILTRWIVTHKQQYQFSLFRWAILFSLGTCLILLPWTIRNYIAFGRIVLVGNDGGLAFWMGNNPLAYGGYVFPNDERLNPFLAIIKDENAFDPLAYKLGLEFIRANPTRVLRLLPMKVFYMYNSNDAGLYWNRQSSVGSKTGTGVTAYMLTNLAYTLLFLLAILGVIALILGKTNRQPLRWIGIIFFICWTAVHLPFIGQDRFALPVLPFVAMYAAYGLSVTLEFKANQST